MSFFGSEPLRQWVTIAETMSTVTRQRVFISRSGVLTVEACLIPIFGVAVMFGVRKIKFFPFLNRHSAKFSIGAVRKFSAAVQVEKIPEEFNSWFFLKVNFTEHLEIAYVGHRVWYNILRMELEASKHIPEKL